MRAVPVTPRHVMFTVCGQCPSLHAEGLTDGLELLLFYRVNVVMVCHMHRFGVNIRKERQERNSKILLLLM